MKPLLYISLRSPFARRVRLLLEELGAEFGAYDTAVIDVFNPPAGFRELNPLGRVPTLKVAAGEVLVDSWAIIDYLRARHGSHPLFLDGAFEVPHRRATAIAVGVMEHAVQHYLESLRPAGQRSPCVLDEYRQVITQGLGELEGRLAATSGPYLFGRELKAADLDLGAAAAYCDLRLGRELVDGFPAIRQHLKRLDQRPAFRKTVPPA